MMLPKNSKDLPALRTFLTTLRTQACSSGEAFTGALKTMRDDLVAKLDSFIAEIPAGDVPGDWCMEDKLQTLCTLLAASIAQASLSALEVAKLQTQMAGAVDAEVQRRIADGELVAKDAVKTAADAAVQAQVTSGALVAKETVTQLCADAKKLGLAEGEQKVRDEVAAAATTAKLIGERKEALQKAGKPLPTAECEKLLGGTEDEFKAVVTKFDTRLAGLNKEGIQLAGSPLLANLYLPDANYAVFETTVKGIDALKTPPTETLAAGGAAKPEKAPLIV